MPTSLISGELPIRQFGKFIAPRARQNLLSIRIASFERFLNEGIDQSLADAGSVSVDMPWRCSVSLHSPELEAPSNTPAECVEAAMTFAARLTAVARMRNEHDEISEQRILLCRLPLMDATGGFIINGVRRVVIHQIVRSPGIWFSSAYDRMSGNIMGHGRASPNKGPWIGFEINDRDELRVRLNGGNAMSALAVLRLYGIGDDELLTDFLDVERVSNRKYLQNTVALNDCPTYENALLQIYDEVSRGAPPNLDTARTRVERLFFNKQNFSLSKVGRDLINRRFGTSEQSLLLTRGDFEHTIRQIVRISNGHAEPDDIDNLANRRVRTAGELVQREFEAGLLDMHHATVEWLQLSKRKPEKPVDVLRTAVLMKRLNSFFSGSQLCQVTDETNPISELTHKRRVSSLGPGGLNRRSAGVEPRDVHTTYYGKICPTETPEGQNIGLLSTLTTGANIDASGFLTCPARPVRGTISSHAPDLAGRELVGSVFCNGLEVAPAGAVLTPEQVALLASSAEMTLNVRRYVSNDSSDIRHLNAYEEGSVVIGQCNARMDALGQLADESVEVRRGQVWTRAYPEEIDFLDLTPRQVVSASTSLIPFLEHDDANRALMGCNMQRQAVPLQNPQSSFVTTGIEPEVARDSGYQVIAERDGIVTSLTADAIEITPDDGGAVQRYPLIKGRRSNAFTHINQRPVVRHFRHVKAGQPIADGHACADGELALGQRVLVAYMSWEGYNYEDAIILSSRLVKEGKFRSTIRKRFSIDAMETPLGAEHITKQVPDAADWRKKVLGEDGIVPVGTFVKEGQMLVGKASPRPLNAEHADREIQPEQKLLHAIFGVTSDNLRFLDKSLLLPKGQDGRVVSVKVIKKGDGSDSARQLPPDCLQRVIVEIAGSRVIQPGDKMSGRHGNKGCVSIIVPEEDMPFLPDGTPIDVMLSPLGVPSRMNLGQLMEVHLGWAAHRMGFRARTPVFDSAEWTEIEQCLAQAWLAEQAGGIRASKLPENDAHAPDWKRIRNWCHKKGHSFEDLFGKDAHLGTTPGALCLLLWMEREGYEPVSGDYTTLRRQAIDIDRNDNKAAPIMGKQVLRDGRTGEELGMPVMVGYKYMLKLGHMVSDKMHARSVGSYAAITQQPLQGKSAGGGQRLGEMEVWALEAYSAAYMLREMLTVKSDDIDGRAEMMKAVMAGGTGQSTMRRPGIPDSFNLLCAELQSLGIKIEFDRCDELGVFPGGGSLSEKH